MAGQTTIIKPNQLSINEHHIRHSLKPRLTPPRLAPEEESKGAYPRSIKGSVQGDKNTVVKSHLTSGLHAASVDGLKTDKCCFLVVFTLPSTEVIMWIARGLISILYIL